MSSHTFIEIKNQDQLLRKLADELYDRSVKRILFSEIREGPINCRILMNHIFNSTTISKATKVLSESHKGEMTVVKERLSERTKADEESGFLIKESDFVYRINLNKVAGDMLLEALKDEGF